MQQLWDDFSDGDNLWHAWEAVRGRHAMAGVDGVSVDEFARCAASHLALLRRDLRQRRYWPAPLKGVSIPKAAGGWRRVGVPTVRDRIAQRACLNVLLPILEPQLEDCSYAYRPGRSIGDALGQLELWRDRGHRFVLESDIENCFDSIDRQQLMALLSRHVGERSLLDLILAWMEAGTVWLERTASQNSERMLSTPYLPPSGIPQGSALSPLLCNLFLDRFDEALLRRHFKLVRYCDDFVIVATRLERTEAALQFSREVLADLGLQLKRSKTRLTTFEQGFGYLGAVFCDGIALGTARREIVRSGRQGHARFVAGYPAPPLLPRHLRPTPPSAPAVDGAEVVSSLLATKEKRPEHSAVAEAFALALNKKRNREHRDLERAAETPWETSYLV